MQVLIGELKKQVQTIQLAQQTQDFQPPKNQIEIYLDTTDIAVSLLFYFKDLIENNNNIILYLKETLYETIIDSFSGDNIFNSTNLKVNQL